ncbi:MAG TPA: DUF4838 domain-containing protein [Chitinophagaceae bacterium]
MKKTIAFLFFLIVLSVPYTQAQKQLGIYADTTNNDTLQRFVAVLKEQLLKSGSYTFSENNTGAYSGKGIYLANVSSGKQKVKPAIKLLGSGTEGFSVIADGQTVQISGNSNLAVGHGLFTWLGSLGYRYYFAHPDWYIVPAKPDLFRKLNIFSKPSLHHRKFFYGYGTGSAKADKDFAFWQLANKMGGTLNAIYGHSYDNIMLRNKEEFKQHPEWFYPPAVKGTLPGEPKFDMSNEGLVQVVIKDVINQIETSLKNGTQAYKMITLGPSDGVGTCNTPACQKLGTLTDRVFYLVNRVAKAIQKKYPLTRVGCLAYSEYIAPPTGNVEPNVYVAITTAFNNSKYTTEQLVKLWSKKGAMVGMYDYFSWYAWDFDIPGQSQASQPFRIAESIRKYQKLGVKGFDGEASIGWVSKGLGYFTAARVMWDVTADVAAIRKEFFDKCFGKASSTIKKMWDEWESYGFTVVRESDLARWIDIVYEAGKQETDPAVHKRLYQVKSYLHYLYLIRIYQFSKTEANLLILLGYGHRTLDDGAVPGYPAFFELGNRSGIPGMAFAPDAKWRSYKTPVTVNEINNLLKQDRAQLKVSVPVEKFVIGTAFRNVPSLGNYKALIADSAAGIDNAFWLVDEWVLQIRSKGASNYIQFIGDMIGDKSNPQPIKIRIYPYTANGEVSTVTPVFSYDYTATQVKEKISLDKLNTGYYTLIIEDPVKIYRLTFSPVINQSVVMRPTRQLKTTSLNYAFIYVPEGVSKFNVIKSRVVKFVTPTGRKVDLTNDKEEDIQVDVQKGESGLWRIKFIADRMYIEGIPPYIGTSPGQMLIPAEKK